MILPPRTPALLTAAGAIPFVFGAAVSLQVIPLDQYTDAITGPGLIIRYGIIILSFMTGIFWGFATRAEPQKAAFGYITSVIPALYAFFFVGGSETSALVALMIGFALLIPIDVSFQRVGLAPPWWLTLRLPITCVVLLCLAGTLASTLIFFKTITYS